MRRVLSTLISAAVLLFGIQVSAQESQAGHSHEQATVHGGKVTMNQEHHFEVVPMMHGVSVFAYDYTQNPIDVSNAEGMITLMTKDGKELTAALKPYSESMAMHEEGQEMMQQGQHMESLLFANLDLSGIDAREAKVTVTITGLQSEEEPQVSFRETIALTDLPQNFSQIMGAHMGSQSQGSHEHGMKE